MRYCGFQVVVEHVGMGENSHTKIHDVLVKELTSHDYTPTFWGDEHFKYIMNYLHSPTINGHVPMEKRLTFLDMGHIIVTYYNNVVIELTKHETNISETFFPITR